ncbi:MAG: DUF1080 domain-containing protein [Balneolaceae bacterium]
MKLFQSLLFCTLNSIAVLFLFCTGIHAQNIELQDLSSFDNPGESWQIAGEVRASLEESNEFRTGDGAGILVNDPGESRGQDLFTAFEHGDIDLELDFMMAKDSNSGIYLQGRYEIQLLDSWAVKVPGAGDNGGIYERWDESRPEGQKGYEGYPPRQNASRAPGVWQNLKVSFQAPRFDEAGNKEENARIISAELNGVTIHEDVELSGPTRGAAGDDEVAQGPLRIQGDHGAVAFRNINIERYDQPVPVLSDLKYEIYEGEFSEEPDLDTLTAVKSGETERLSSAPDLMPGQFLIRYRGMIHTSAAGDYLFSLNGAGGAALLRIDGDEVVDIDDNEGSVTLPEGAIPFELLYARQSRSGNPYLQLAVSGEGFCRHLLSDEIVAGRRGGRTIYARAADKPLLRSFMDLPDGSRVTHAVSVSSLEKLHYTYDLNHGSLVQVWRGNFLNTTPMWYNRGDGSSRPEGTVEHLVPNPSLAINKLESGEASWSDDTAGTGFRSWGYRLDKNDNPVFVYEIYSAVVSDEIRVVDDGRGLRRSITVENPADDLYIRLATGTTIERDENNQYLVDDHSYYLRLDDPVDSEPVVRTVEGQQELLVPVQSILNYTILF